MGTLWRMERRGRSARCALLAWPGEWEIRLVVDGETRSTERCVSAGDAFALAERWKRRILDHGWQQIVPGSAAGRESSRA